MDLTEAEEIQEWQEYTEEMYKKDLHYLNKHDGMAIHLEPDIPGCKVKWEALPQVKPVEVILSYFKS